MNVCLLNDSFPPVIDGVVNVVVNYANYLTQDYGCKVAVGTPEYPGADYSAYPYEVVPYPSLDTAAVASGYRAGFPFDAKSIGELVDFRPDIIHTHCPASATVIARLLREETDAPVVFTYHTKYDIDIMRTVKLKPIAEEGIKAMVSNIEACDEIWVVSRGAGESLKALGFQGDYRVMNNGVDFAKGRADSALVEEVTKGYDLPEGVPVFLFVGRLMTYKGLPLILDALKQVDAAGKDFRMVFVGKGPDRELLEKSAQGAYAGAELHFIGHLQKNKVKHVVGLASLIHSVDSLELLAAIDRCAAARGLTQDVLLEINIGDEASKSGLRPEELPAMLEKTAKFGSVRVRGLMTIPPICSSPEENRPFFLRMQQLFVDNGRKKYDNVSMDFLSMGMSGDYLAAVACGANMVRIGSAIFGRRLYPNR